MARRPKCTCDACPACTLRRKRRRHYLKHRDAVLAKQAKYRAANAEQVRAQQAEWREANKETLKHRNFEKSYNISWEQREQMLAEQDWRCANPGCRTTDPGGRGEWHMDHDHACCPQRAKSCGGCLRGLLCSRCNVVLGYVKDDPDVLHGAAEYLQLRSRMRPAAG